MVVCVMRQITKLILDKKRDRKITHLYQLDQSKEGISFVIKELNQSKIKSK